MTAAIVLAAFLFGAVPCAIQPDGFLSNGQTIYAEVAEQTGDVVDYKAQEVFALRVFVARKPGDWSPESAPSCDDHTVDADKQAVCYYDLLGPQFDVDMDSWTFYSDVSLSHINGSSVLLCNAANAKSKIH